MLARLGSTVAILICVAALLPACAKSAGATRGVWTTDALSVPNSIQSRRAVFGDGETPVLVVSGYGGTTVTIQVIRVPSAERVGPPETVYVPPGSNYTVHIANLPTGAYAAQLLVGGVLTDAYTFTVRRSGERGAEPVAQVSTPSSSETVVLSMARWDGPVDEQDSPVSSKEAFQGQLAPLPTSGALLCGNDVVVLTWVWPLEYNERSLSLQLVSDDGFRGDLGTHRLQSPQRLDALYFSLQSIKLDHLRQENWVPELARYSLNAALDGEPLPEAKLAFVVDYASQRQRAADASRLAQLPKATRIEGQALICSRWVDHNKDGRLALAELEGKQVDFVSPAKVGRTKSFSLVLASLARGGSGNIGFQLLDSQGNVIRSAEYDRAGPDIVSRSDAKAPLDGGAIIVELRAATLAVGDYTAVWRLENHTSKVRFSIIEE